MSKLQDLQKLKELLELKKDIKVLGKNKVVRYNELLEWALKTYGHINSVKLINNNVSVEGYYRIIKNISFLQRGNYYFLNRYFGNRYVFLRNAFYDAHTGEEIKTIDKKIKESAHLIEKEYPCVLFIVFVEYKNVFIVEDVVTAGNNKLIYKILDFAKFIGLRSNSYIALKIVEQKLNNQYYKLILSNIHRDSSFYVSGLLCVSEEDVIRRVIKPKPKEFCCIQHIKLEHISDNKWIPYAITFNDEIVRVTGYSDLLSSQLYMYSFVPVLKCEDVMLLPELSKPDNPIPKNEYLRKIMGYFNNEFFVSDNYFVKTGMVGIDDLCNDEIIKKIYKDTKINNKFNNKSIFDLACEYFLYDKVKIVKLINKIDFKLDDDNKIIGYNLIPDADLFEKDPSLEDIYMKFHKFVVIFNALTACKRSTL